MPLVDTPVHRRRRRLASAALAATAASVGALAGARHGDEQPAPAARGTPTPAPTPQPQPLSIERAAGKVIVLRFAGPSAPGYVRRTLREHRAVGAILFRDNLVDRAQARRLTRVLHRGVGGRGALIAVDQEGGAVRAVRWAGPERAPAAQAAGGTVRAAARAAGRLLRAAGVTVALAPVADVPSVRGAALAARAFARDPQQAARATAASVHGWLDAGVLPAVKHFPGLGAATRNTDDAIVQITRSRTALERVDLPPFTAAIRAGTPLVMVGHARYPAFDRAQIASQSRPILQDLLRGELAFKGAVVTDSLEADAVLRRASIEVAAVQSIAAGCDLLLLTGPGSAIRVYRALRERARRDRDFAARLREAAGRVDALRRRIPPGAAGGR